MEFFRWLFDGEAFVTRSHCGHWTPALVAAWQAGNALIAAAYFLIPVKMGLVLWRRRLEGRSLPHAGVAGMFAAFILLCGLTHASEIVVFYWAPYRLWTGLYFLTGLVSAATAAMIWPACNYALRAATPAEYEAKVREAERQREIMEACEQLTRIQAAELRREMENLRHRAESIESARSPDDTADQAQAMLLEITRIQQRFTGKP
jgi:hypothetical protein